MKAAVTLSASPASQTEQGSSWRVDPDEAKVLLGFHESFLCSWNPFGGQGGSHGVVLGEVFARREMITPAQLQVLLLELMAPLSQG